jgi:hypothetical protein
MNRSNLAVCFGPVIFKMDYDLSKTKLKLGKKAIKEERRDLKFLSVPSNPVLLRPSSLTLLKNTDNQIELSADVQTSTSNKSELDINNISTQTDSTLPKFDSNQIVPDLSTNHSENQLADKSSGSNSKESDVKESPIDSISEFSKELSVERNGASLTSLKNDYSDEKNSPTQPINNRMNKNFSSLKKNVESMSSIVQLCVSDMIKYSVDLFTVSIENYKTLDVISLELYDIEHFYDFNEHKLKKNEFFKNDIDIEKIYWLYYDKYEDVSIYFFKNDYSTKDASAITTTVVQQHQSHSKEHRLSFKIDKKMTSNLDPKFLKNPNSVFLSSNCESFSNNLKLWKCCTLVKHTNLSLEKILARIKYERFDSPKVL